MPTVLTRVSCLSVRSVITASMPIWWVPEISRCERCWPGKTGLARVSCQYALMRRTTKPKHCALRGTVSCGGVQMQAPAFRHGVQLTFAHSSSMLQYRRGKAQLPIKSWIRKSDDERNFWHAHYGCGIAAGNGGRCD